VDDLNVTSAIDNDDFQQQTYFNLQCDYYDANYPKEHKWLGLMHVLLCLALAYALPSSRRHCCVRASLYQLMGYSYKLQKL
jgi:hypothetical protein